MPCASVILSTYNSPRALDLVLTGYRCQQAGDFELVIADDGSREETRDLVRRHKRESGLPILHVWQADDGFQKCRILNKAIAAARSDYLVFTDGDCIPRADFLDVHLRARRPNQYVSGAMFRLSEAATAAVQRSDVEAQAVFKTDWLLAHGQPRQYRHLWKLTRRPWLATVLESLSTAPASWNGANSSCWKADAIKVNGFDERMRYGSEDREFGERLVNAGVGTRKVRYSAAIVHLEHSRGYETRETWTANRAIRERTLRERLSWTDHGLKPHLGQASTHLIE